MLSRPGVCSTKGTGQAIRRVTVDQAIVFATLLMALALFAWGRIRYDIVALLSLFVVVVAGIVEPGTAFLGFGHPAVITVVSVLIIGKALESSGLIDVLGRWITGVGTSLVLQILALSSLVAVASAFMNNTGALAITLPIAIHVARKSGHSPSYVLMPIAFASLLGGMTTLIGTPPNIIISSFRANETGTAFGMFDFLPVGGLLTLVGVAFIAFVGWRLLPRRAAPKSDAYIFDIDDYIIEIEVTPESKAVGMTIGDFIELAGVDMQVLGIVRNHIRVHAPKSDRTLEAGDVAIIESDADELKTILENTGVNLVGHSGSFEDTVGSRDITVTEAVVMANSPIIGGSTLTLQFRRRYGINLLAVARKESRIHRRLVNIIFQAGDVLLLQGRENALADMISALGCLPLARRDLKLGYRKRIPAALAIFGAAIASVVAGLLPVEVAFSMGAVAMVLSGILPIKDVYNSVDWPVIVLLGAMIPVGGALETTGGAGRIANAVMMVGRDAPPWILLSAIMTVTMLLSAVINNAATVILMAPIALGIARGLGYSVDPFLMAVAIGGSAAFLTPIGHQSNTLVMGPGGYRFTDFTRMGLPMTVMMFGVGVPLILWFFPV
jgi:di/tricarboxylate transporter